MQLTIIKFFSQFHVYNRSFKYSVSLFGWIGFLYPLRYTCVFEIVCHICFTNMISLDDFGSFQIIKPCYSAYCVAMYTVKDIRCYAQVYELQ